MRKRGLDAVCAYVCVCVCMCVEVCVYGLLRVQPLLLSLSWTRHWLWRLLCLVLNTLNFIAGCEGSGSAACKLTNKTIFDLLNKKKRSFFPPPAAMFDVGSRVLKQKLALHI